MCQQGVKGKCVPVEGGGEGKKGAGRGPMCIERRGAARVEDYTLT